MELYFHVGKIIGQFQAVSAQEGTS